MKHIITATLIATVSALLLSGCWDSEAEQKAKEQKQRSKDFWDMGGPTDRSKDKGF